ncbi:MAG: host-nuclease inhibitor Gam family protein [Candidatus Kapabacteria bacterium]|nr:host-nuclease inhibitor Gam family protein [Candidatus Kapabacteria bacterium]
MAKKKKSNITSWEDCKAHLAKAAVLDAEIAKETADYNAQEQELRKLFEQGIAERNATKQMLEKEIELFCKENADVFTNERTLDLVHGTVGFKHTTPAVTLIAGIQEEGALNLLRKHEADEFIRTKEEINRDAIKIAYAAGNLTADELELYGLRITQKDKFHLKYNHALEVSNG